MTLKKTLKFCENIFKMPGILKKKPYIFKKNLATNAALPQWLVRLWVLLQHFTQLYASK
jgi:hypothetical protein